MQKDLKVNLNPDDADDKDQSIDYIRKVGLDVIYLF